MNWDDFELNLNWDKLQLLGEGISRITYLLPSKRYVVKIPNAYLGVTHNQREARRYKELPDKPLARCRLVGPKNTLLVMEYVKPKHFRFIDESKPAWVGCIDRDQVGYNLSGKLVAYDFGQNKLSFAKRPLTRDPDPWR